ncbi:MAG: sigma-70 family RNA polymerase sigma factor [bacterium]|nr:sigma-70 family RNA polymerase sigma factor [bacterium]
MELSPKEFAELVERESPKLATLLARLIPVRDRVPDLLQDVWIAVWRGLPWFRGESAITTWIWKIAYRTALKERNRIYGRLDTVELLEEMDSSKHTLSVEDEIDRKDTLEKMISCLSPIQRTVVTMFYLENFSISEIAEIIGQAEGTVKSHLFRARQKMMQTISE